MKNKKLYRKKNTHWRNGSLSYYDYTAGKYKYSRRTKRTKKDIEDGVQREKIKTNKRGYDALDYTPLYKFLESSVGRKWCDVWREALKKVSGNYEQILYIVGNVNKSGLVCKMPDSCYKKGDDSGIVRIGEGSYYSELYVDKSGILQEVNPDAWKKFEEWYTGNNAYEDGWTDTLNGKTKMRIKYSEQKKEDRLF